MARIRTLKPEMWMSPQVMNLSVHARLLFIGLITQADDEGRGIADARRLKAAVFAGDDILSGHVDEWLAEVVKQGLAVVYDGGEHGRIYQLPTWRAHQSIDKPKPSRYPQLKKQSPNGSGRVDDASPTSREGSEGSEGSKGSDARARDPAKGGSLRAVGSEVEPWLRGTA
jgi:hypothetical protein